LLVYITKIRMDLLITYAIQLNIIIYDGSKAFPKVPIT
jgi:hypothetical protein